MNKKGVLLGPRRGNQKRFPYEPRLVGGRLVMPAELQALHQSLLAGEAVAARTWLEMGVAQSR